MVELTRAEQHLAEKTICVMLLRGETADGEGVYAYIAVRADRLPDLMKAQSEPGFNPEEYGAILEHGTGDPSPEVRARMEEEYQFNHENMVFLSDQNTQ